MKKRILSCLFLLALINTTNVFAHGKKDTEEKNATNLSSWRETFDINDKKKGKYNIFITASDLGGNQIIDGPFNLYVDPKSDLPICGITNPQQDMRIVGNLNIVGTCIDDDSVDHVDLILDGKEDAPVRAKGKEFWSYYLNTRELEEGQHSIKVIGYDINGLASEPYSLTWELDRRQPVTAIEDHTMGQLVSGTVKFNGTVTDGNGIRKLEYSLDNGKNFLELPLVEKKDGTHFSLTIDTKKVKPIITNPEEESSETASSDGPAVIWFKAQDKSGSTGIYSFLYYIDNTSPEVKIVYPKDSKEAQFGKFVVAGYAKDKVGITKLTWAFGEETGEFEVIPGNPYWGIILDATKIQDSSRKFTVTATDVAGNEISVSETLKFNPELDKPVVTITEPAANSYVDEADDLYVRGFVTDEDGVQSVKYKLDNGEFSEIETKGAFYAKIIPVNLIPVNASGSKEHTITVIAKDKNGTEGNPTVVRFMVQGAAPEFSDLRVGADVVTDGFKIHPESGGSISGSVSSSTGLTGFKYSLRWGRNGVIENDAGELKNPSSYSFNIPIKADSPKGVMKLTLTATDALGRTADYKTIFYVENTSDYKGNEPKVAFDDSTVSPEGVIVVDKDIDYGKFPVSGYFIGGNIKSVATVPDITDAKTGFLKKITNRGNLISMEFNTKTIGSSEPFIVRVTTDQGLTFDSRQLTIKNDTSIPKVVIRADGKNNTGKAFDVQSIYNKKVEEAQKAADEAKAANPDADVPPVNVVLDPIKISARASSGTAAFRYRIFTIRLDLDKKDNWMKGANIEKSGDMELSAGESNELEFDPNSYSNKNAIFIYEFTAENAAGNKVSEALMIKNIDSYSGKKAIKPLIKWVTEGENIYSAVAYQGTLEAGDLFKVFKRDALVEGDNNLTHDGVVPEVSNLKDVNHTVNKPANLKVVFARVGSESYTSGMTVGVPAGKSPERYPVITANIYTGAKVTGASYEISGDSVPGGDVKSAGVIKTINPPVSGSNYWTVEIPLVNLPVRITQIKLSVKAAGGMQKDVIGYIKVVRPDSDATKIDDKRSIYILESGGCTYDAENASYVMRAGGKLNFYANVPGPVAAGGLASEKKGLRAEANGNLVTVFVDDDGDYSDVAVKVTDANGASYTSSPIKIKCFTNPPEVNITAPVMNQWVRRTLRISGTAADAAGIKGGEYSIDGGENWLPLNLTFASGGKNNQGATFSATADISSREDGIVKVDVRITDLAGHVKYARNAAFKDTTVPNVEVIEPEDEDIVNGNTLIIFKVTDNGSFEKVNYVAPPVAKGEVRKVELENTKYVMTHIGTDEKPISDAMSFEFIDGASNKNNMEAWKFSIDSESDLPVAEIHLPTYEEVVTRDFTISGVVYDDDGACQIFYRIDNNEYQQLPGVSTSFAIDVPFSSMTDNEHTINVYAIDANGVKGNVAERKFRVSTEEPKGSVDSPTIDNAVKGVVTLKGVTSDKNGIDKVYVSVDNGNSYNLVTGTNSWTYTFDTRAIPNGTQVVFLRVIDKYGIEGLYSSLINIDNEAPEMSLELPLDYASTAGPVFFSGNVFDNVDITDLYVSVRSFDGKTISSNMAKINFNKDNIIAQTIDLSSLENGVYNLEVTALDKAGNATHVSRNIQLNKNKPLANVSLLYPLNGEKKNGNFNIYGEITADKPVEQVTLYIDGVYIEDTELKDTGYFRFCLTPEKISTGVHKYRVDVRVEGGNVIKSREQTVDYNSIGPWLTVDNFAYGDFAVNRPFIYGHTGYSLDEEDVLLAKAKKASKEDKARIAKKSVAKVEVSFNNGKTFTQISSKEKWRYRVENEDLREGFHFMLVRSTMKTGEIAIERVIIQIDNSAPKIKLISPSEGGRYNQELTFSGLTSDEIGMKEVKLTLRKGDKSSYQVPAFIQGLYLDWHFWGATLFDIGAGLTFFDDNVKIQFQWGQFTQAQRDMFSKTDMRYGGDNVLGLKILANVAQIPFSYFFGRDWDSVSSSIAVGANFTYFNETNSGKGQILSALVAQVEIPKFTFPKMKMFSAFSFYTEFTLWFIPTDVSSTGTDIKNLIPQFSEGIRLNVF